MDKELLNILVCPKTKKKLALAPSNIIAKVNEKVLAGTCKDISGEPVNDPVEEGLYQAETHIFYLIRDGIPLLIYDNAILIDNL